MIGNISRLKGQRGFSMAELVIAFTLLTCSVLGVTFMITSGHTNIIRGAKELKAANLASKRIEEIKSLPFYKSYTGTPATINDPAYNKDIDDFYWDPQRENYGAIPGFGSYKRDTAIMYQYVNGSGVLADATMDSDWRPKGLSGSLTDVPTGGAAGDTDHALHAILIQVKVYYMQDGLEKTYTAQGIAGDLMITGGTNSPPLVITSIAPTEADLGTANLAMTIYVTSDGRLDSESDLTAYLWYAGTSDVTCITGVAHTAAPYTTITCNFDLRPDAAGNPRVGWYNVGVYWRDEGWRAVFRDNTFKVNAPPLTLTGLSTHNWGHTGQNGRQVTLVGSNFWGASVQLKGPTLDPNANAYTINGTAPVVSPDGTTLTTTFNLNGDATTRRADTWWNIEIDGASADISTDLDGDNSRRFHLNPVPVIDSVVKCTQTSPYTADYDQTAWSYRQKPSPYQYVRVEGHYLYGMTSPDTGTSRIKYTESYQTNVGTVASASAQLTCVETDPVVFNYNPQTTSAGITAYNSDYDNKRWQITLTNYGGTSNSDNSYSDWTKTVLMNPPPKISDVTNFTDLTTGTASSTNPNKSGTTFNNLSVAGGYFQASRQVEFIKSAAVSPPAGTPYVDISAGTLNGDGQSAGMSMTGQSMIVTVGNSMNFKQWPGATAAADTSLTNDGNEGLGSYYVLLINADQQAVTYGPVTLNHAQWNITATASPAGWGSVNSPGALWQDTAYTITPANISLAGNYVGVFRGWGSPGDHTWTALTNQTGTATADTSFTARFGKLLWDGNNSSPNYAGFGDGKWNTKCESSYAYDDTYWCMREHAWGTAGAWSNNDAECSGATTNKFNFTGASTMWIYWRQINGTVCTENWTLNISGARDDDQNQGQKIGHQGADGWFWEDTGVALATTNYIHVNAYAEGSWPYLNGNSDTRVGFIFVQ